MNNNEQPVDKIELHYRQQVSALVDGELASDEARFLLRRLQHDPELQACQERWQLLGDVMRGQVVVPAPADFAARVSASVASEPAPAAASRRDTRVGWRRWGGGAALAASVAAVALFMGRQSLDSSAPEADAPIQVIASQAELPTPTPATVAEAAPSVALVASVPAAAMAVASRRQEASERRASATRNQQVARVAQRSGQPERAIAAVAVPLKPTTPSTSQAILPFGDAGALQARPWPRSSVGATAGGVLNASYPASTRGTFYPFEPRLQDDLQEQGRGD